MKKISLFICLFISLNWEGQVVVYDINQEIEFNISNEGTGQIDFDTISIPFSGTNLDFIFRFIDYSNGPQGYPDFYTPKLHTVLMNTSQIEVSSFYGGPGQTNGNGIVFNDIFCSENFPNYWPTVWEVGGSWGFNENDSIGPNHFTFSGQALLREGIIGHSAIDFNDWVFCGSCFQSFQYLGIRILIEGSVYYGWMKLETEYGIHIEKIGINETPEQGILAGQIDEINGPFGLNQSYTQAPYGIYLNWEVFPNSQACQVRGGLAGGNDPHNFIITGNEPNQKFINGNSLITGQEYQWKVRCATGLNPYSGVSAWSDYDYFIYQP